MKNYLMFVLVVGIVSTVMLSTTSVYGQEDNETEWLTYNDPEDKFSLEYPTDWELESKENRFDIKDFIVSTKDEGNSVSIGMTSIQFEGKKGDIEDGEEIIVPGLENRDNFRLIESWECEKYTIDDEKSCSIVFTSGSSPFNFAEMNVYLNSDNGIHTIIYKTTSNLFDKHLPSAEKIIESIKILDD